MKSKLYSEGQMKTETILEREYHGRPYDELVRLCSAYANGMHDLADECQKLRWRIQMAEKARRMFDNLEIA
jgi:hypothetical protein